jgi:hypothetical protein
MMLLGAVLFGAAVFLVGLTAVTRRPPPFERVEPTRLRLARARPRRTLRSA